MQRQSQYYKNGMDEIVLYSVHAFTIEFEFSHSASFIAINICLTQMKDNGVKKHSANRNAHFFS